MSKHREEGSITQCGESEKVCSLILDTAFSSACDLYEQCNWAAALRLFKELDEIFNYPDAKNMAELCRAPLESIGYKSEGQEM